MKKVKIIKRSTCRAIFEVTNDQNHFEKCPIIMEKSVWLAIKPSVMMKKKSNSGIADFFDEIMGSIFGNPKTPNS